MSWLRVRVDTLPAELQALPAVLWRAKPGINDKPAKVPYRITEPTRRASSTNPATWGTLEDAAEAYAALVDEPADPARGPIAGIGVVLTREASVTCIDPDRVIASDGGVDVRAETIVERCDSFTDEPHRETRRAGEVTGRFYRVPLTRFRWGLKSIRLGNPGNLARGA